MSQHQGRPVSGDQPQSDEAVATVNALKTAEEQILRFLDDLAGSVPLAVDKSWLALGRTHIEQGFMAVNRSVFKPERVAIPEEDDAIVETAWVLERADSDPSEPLYYAPWNSGEQWSRDNSFALRLARREDAERLAVSLATQVRVAEHQWG